MPAAKKTKKVPVKKVTKKAPVKKATAVKKIAAKKAPVKKTVDLDEYANEIHEILGLTNDDINFDDKFNLDKFNLINNNYKIDAVRKAAERYDDINLKLTKVKLIEEMIGKTYADMIAAEAAADEMMDAALVAKHQKVTIKKTATKKATAAKKGPVNATAAIKKSAAKQQPTKSGNIDVKIDKLDYIILETGYTGRIVTRLVKSGLAKIQKLKTKTVVKLDDIVQTADDNDDRLVDIDFNEFGDGDVEDQFEEFFSLLQYTVFIYDKLWGDGYYEFNKKEADDVSKVVDLTTISGGICIKTNNLFTGISWVNMLATMDYCAYLSPGGITSIRYIAKDGVKLAIVGFDAESG